MVLIDTLKHYIPRKWKEFLKGKVLFIKALYLNVHYRVNVKRIRKQKNVNVCFFVLYDSICKIDYLYNLMSKESTFNPVIVVCPVINRGPDFMRVKMQETYLFFLSKGYNVIKAYSEEDNTYLDIKSLIKPDIIFYTNPYDGVIDSRFSINNFTTSLTCYIPYFSSESNWWDMCVNQPLQNLVWKFFIESSYVLKKCHEVMVNKGKNVYVSGFPGYDILNDYTYSPVDVWKIKNSKMKRIIWAPHHSFMPTDPLHYSNFLNYYELMLNLAEKYRQQIQIAFKPHPLLRPNLEKYWGIAKTNEYFARWNNADNIFYTEGNYIDLFLTSDAMIHDCGSFLKEYLYLNKPCLETYYRRDFENIFNEDALECLEYYYHIDSEFDVESFIKNVIDSNDPLLQNRTVFINDRLGRSKSPNASKVIFSYLKDTLHK